MSTSRCPTWSKATSELFYAVNRQVMVVPFVAGMDAFRAERPHIWAGGLAEQRGQWRMFDIHPDGQRLALRLAESDRAKQYHVTLVFNFFDQLRRIAPVKK